MKAKKGKHKSAVTGRFIKSDEAEKNPRETYKVSSKKAKKK